MPRRLVFATALVVSLAGLGHSGTFLASITKVEGNKVTYRRCGQCFRAVRTRVSGGTVG
jgi:hypothetical protein